MAGIFLDGFASSDHATKYSAVGGTIAVGTSLARTSGASYINITGAGPLVRKSITAVSEIFIGCGVYVSTVGSSAWYFTFRGDSNATTHITVMINASGLIEVRRGNTSGTVLATGATTLSANTWYYIEIRATIADSGGIVQVRINGSGSNEINFSGDTRNAGTNTTIDSVEVGAGTNITSNLRADLYINDTSGSINNTWEGDVKVSVLRPSGAGNYTQLTASSGANYTTVDETAVASADYNAGAQGSTLRDSYALSDLPAGVSAINALQVVCSWLKSDAGTGNAKTLIRSNSTNDEGSSTALSTSLTTGTKIYDTDPGNSNVAWTAAAVNALEAGMTVP